MALLVNKKLLNFRWVDADLTLSLSALPALARVKSITGLTAPAAGGVNNQSVCKVAGGKLSGTLKKLVRGQEYQLEAASWAGWTLAGAVLVAQLVIAVPGGPSEPAPITLTGIVLNGPASVSEGASGQYSVVATYSNSVTGVLSTGLTWSANAPGGVLTIAADDVYGNGRSVTVTVATDGLSAQRVVQVLDATTAPQLDPTPDTGQRRQTVGVFDVATNTLVAMPIIDEPYTAGKIKWDGLDIRGKATDSKRAYQARPISNAADLSVLATWKGILANNSDSFTGAGVWGSNRPSCMVFKKGKGRYGASYIERGPGHCHFLVAKPGARVLNPSYLTESQSVDAVCSDADRTYHAGVSFGHIANPESGQTDYGYFITATNNNDESPYTFPKGYNFRSETQTYSAVDVPQVLFLARGIAVQQAGRVLASLHPDRVVFFDKVQGGEALGFVLLDQPTAITFLDDSTLAILHSGNVVELYTFEAEALTLKSLRTVPLPAGYVPHSMDISPVAPTFSILCGAADFSLTSTATHRILHYDTRNYDAAPRVDGSGDLGIDPRVTDDTFCFFDTVKFDTVGHSYLAYQEDGTYWFMDDGNKREQHRAADGTLLYTRYCAGTTYNPYVNATDPTRVFNDYLEYEVDHSKPRTPANTNNWWKLKYNRSCFRNAEYDGGTRGFNITTTPAGRTFSLERWNYNWILAEWTAQGITYYPNISIDLTSAMDRNGDLLEVEGFYSGNTKRIFRSVLNGYGDNGPTYAVRVDEGSAPLATDTPNATGLFCGPTTDGTYGCFALADVRFHLGGIQRGAKAFRFETAESTWTNYQGPWPAKGQYDVGNGVWYQGSFLLSIDNYFIWACRAERWKNGQVVKFIITTSDGRYIGQFGTVRDGAFKDLIEPAAAGQGGNALTGQVVKVGTKYVLMHGDENAHGGVHLWEFDLSTVREEQAYDIVATEPEPLPGIDLMGNIPFDNLGLGSGSTIGNWKTMGDMRAETSRLSRTSLTFFIGGGGRAYALFPPFVGDRPGYVVVGFYAWMQLGGYELFYYPIAGLDFRDVNGVPFLRLAHNDDGNGNTVNTANGVVITTGVALVAAQETAELRPFYLRVAPDGKLFFSYNGRDEQALPPFTGTDPLTKQPYPAANPLRPGTVELNFINYKNASLQFAVDQLRLLPA
jgi:hypothetical protein